MSLYFTDICGLIQYIHEYGPKRDGTFFNTEIWNSVGIMWAK